MVLPPFRSDLWYIDKAGWVNSGNRITIIQPFILTLPFNMNWKLKLMLFCVAAVLLLSAPGCSLFKSGGCHCPPVGDK